MGACRVTVRAAKPRKDFSREGAKKKLRREAFGHSSRVAFSFAPLRDQNWVPAFAGMTKEMQVCGA
jgi:hypothetical protein